MTLFNHINTGRFRLACILISLLLGSAISTPAHAEEINIKLGKPKGSTSRPKIPERQQVYCTYITNVVFFTFTFSEGEVSLILVDLNTGEVINADFNSASSQPIEVGYHQSASITVTTEAGNTYYGEW